MKAIYLCLYFCIYSLEKDVFVAKKKGIKLFLMVLSNINQSSTLKCNYFNKYPCSIILVLDTFNDLKISILFTQFYWQKTLLLLYPIPVPN